MVNCKGVELRNLHFSAFYPSHSISERYGIDLSPNLGAGDLEYVHFHKFRFFKYSRRFKFSTYVMWNLWTYTRRKS